jgi:BNR repeat-like domain
VRRTAGILLTLVALAAGTVTADALVGVSERQANQPQVQGAPSSNTSAVFPTNKQNEPTIAVNPVNPSLVIAGSNDEQRQPPCGPGAVRGTTLASDCSFFPGVGTSGVYTSSDGGSTWINRGLLDDQTSWKNKGVVSDGDPVLAYGPKPDAAGRFSWANGARAYYSSLASLNALKGTEYIIVSVSDDNGLTWTAPVVATTKTSSSDFNDKNWIAVDTTPTSPSFGRVYVSWTEFRSATTTGNGAEPVMVSSSSDGGASFGAPNQLSPAGNNGTGNGRQGSSVTTGPDGSVYVAFEEANSQVVAISRDGGKSFAKARVIGPVTDIADPIPGANFRTDSFPTIGADPRTSSTTVYASWATRTAGGGRIVVATSTDRGQTWGAPVQVSGTEGYAFFQGLDVTDSGKVVVAYQVLKAIDPTRFGTGNAAIDVYAASKPAAAAWTAPAKLTTQSSDPAASAQNNLQRQFWGDYNVLVATDSAAWFISTDSRTGVGCPDVDAYQKYLRDNGLATRGDMADRVSRRTTGINPALSDPSIKPSPPAVCGPQFGNTELYVSKFIP